MRRLSLLFPILLAACTRTKAVDLADASTADHAPVFTRVELEGTKLVQAWNAAIDRQDESALQRLYADRVFFYSGFRQRDQVVWWKAKNGGTDFHQQILGKIEISVDGRQATFVKLEQHGSRTEESWTRLGLEGTPLHIVREEDPPPPGGTCEAIASDIVWALPETKRQVEELLKTVYADPQLHLARIRRAAPDHAPSGAIGIHRPGHLEPKIFYAVEDGVLKIDLYAIEPADAAKVKDACVKK